MDGLIDLEVPICPWGLVRLMIFRNFTAGIP